ncbi:hypothetical protein ACJIZ3_018543 [Penstemon smallii]|uniref:WRKY domain-containing protein n=1 Tax=Penstemon smallii TaxID=265156 RepID=A0ABD3SZA3_9LAMI
MEKVGTLDKKTVISELTQGKELANELKKQLYPIMTSPEACGLVDKILSSYDNALSLINCMALLGNENLFSPNSLQGSPRSEGKTSPRWSEQVRVCSGPGLDGQVNDAYNWRKYGQKDILGANHPRAYYRCTHRHTQGCLATKQVQKMDDDPSIFEVIYKGNHSCIQQRLKKKEEKTERYEAGLGEVKIQEVHSKEESHPFISFPSTPVESETVEAHIFPELLNFSKPNYSPQLLSPATSESYLTQSPCLVNDFWPETISHSTPLGEDLDFLIDQEDFESNFIDISDYLP